MKRMKRLIWIISCLTFISGMALVCAFVWLGGLWGIRLVRAVTAKNSVLGGFLGIFSLIIALGILEWLVEVIVMFPSTCFRDLRMWLVDLPAIYKARQKAQAAEKTRQRESADQERLQQLRIDQARSRLEALRRQPEPQDVRDRKLLFPNACPRCSFRLAVGDRSYSYSEFQTGRLDELKRENANTQPIFCECLQCHFHFPAVEPFEITSRYEVICEGDPCDILLESDISLGWTGEQVKMALAAYKEYLQVSILKFHSPYLSREQSERIPDSSPELTPSA